MFLLRYACNLVRSADLEAVKIARIRKDFSLTAINKILKQNRRKRSFFRNSHCKAGKIVFLHLKESEFRYNTKIEGGNLYVLLAVASISQAKILLKLIRKNPPGFN